MVWSRVREDDEAGDKSGTVHGEPLASHPRPAVRAGRRHHADALVDSERIAAAKQLLEVTDLAVDRIAFDVGSGSPVTFRATFTQEVGVSPGRYRSRFAAGADADSPASDGRLVGH